VASGREGEEDEEDGRQKRREMKYEQKGHMKGIR
jgi:hypothetical protein